MEIFQLSARLLAVYLMIISILGNISNVLIFMQTLNVRVGIETPLVPKNFTSTNNSEVSSVTKASPNFENEDNIRTFLSSSWNYLVDQSVLLYEISFPITKTSIATYQENPVQMPTPCSQVSSVDIPMPALLLTTLSSFYLLRGTLQMDYSYCQFWYYIQVGSMLYCCMKITILTWLHLWNDITSSILFSLLFALVQLCIVQKFMEDLSRHLIANTQQKKCQVFPMKNSDLDTCRLCLL